MANGVIDKRDPSFSAEATGAPWAATAILPLFAATLFLSALLLFWIQPMFAKMVLPLLGGAPNVWNTAMVFFQATLLAGYAYAHATTRLFPLHRQVLIHLAIGALALVSLPVVVANIPPVEGAPILWLMVLLAVSIGLPFFAVSATAPLLQRWFGLSDHARAGDPYFLYGASNLGSILALLCYPLVFEPLLRLGHQGWIWTGGYCVLVALIAACGIRVLRSEGRPAAAAAVALPEDGVSWRRRVHWVALAFAPSSLLLGVTAHITTDVAAVPLLWVVPLALYLLTYVLVFARRPPLPHSRVVALQPYLLFAAWMFLPIMSALWMVISIHLAVFFVTAMVCHGELVRRRPATSHLTEFYLLMAFGGVLGGVFNALIAPLLFTGIYEYGLALIVACLLRPWRTGGGARARVLDFVLPGIVLGAMLFVTGVADLDAAAHTVYLFLFAVAVGVAVFSFKDRPVRFGLGVGAVLFALFVFAGADNVLDQQRSFFGVYRVKSEEGGRVHVLTNGTIMHGAQFTDPARRREPAGYYTRQGPLGQVFTALEGTRRVRTVGLVGLGAGATLCYARPGQDWTVYEIDPLVGRLARNPAYFQYWSECLDPQRSRIVYGDARISLRHVPDGRFDLLILDAYSSDAVPAHLITRQALELYRAKLSPNGLLVFNLSNRHLDLGRVMGALVADAGMAGLIQTHVPEKEAGPYHWASVWGVVAANPAGLAFLSADPRWKRLQAPPAADIWTDDFSNILRALK
ncbi:MAG: fused MFS/spermidine synthase [Alphaproteobacteria bacterium]